MDYNLIPPFMLWEAGITIIDTPTIQSMDHKIEYHLIFFSETGLRIPLSLWGVLSYFTTSKPSLSDMIDSEDVYVLTRSWWEPHQMDFA